MYERCNKKRIYLLIDLYLSGKITAWDFCDEYHNCYDVEIDLNTLTPLEARVFAELSNIAGRFTDIQEDLQKYPGTYFTEEVLKQKIIKTKEILKNE